MRIDDTDGNLSRARVRLPPDKLGSRTTLPRVSVGKVQARLGARFGSPA